MDKRIKYSFKEKLSIARSVISGQDSLKSAARKIGGNDKTVQRWVNIYRQYGKKGLELRHGSYDGSFKVRVIKHMLKNQLSLMQTTAIFGIPHDYTVGRWLKTYERLGAAGLLREARGRKKSLMAKKTKKKQKDTTADPSAEKVAALQKELEYLRAENAFLKKLDALIQQEKAAKAQGKRPKPSRN